MKGHSFTSCDQRRDVGAFTMVEVAICLGVIGIALVAIIGVLPTGMTVQRDNREETIINQDATYWMEAIRNGERGLDDLTNYVESITVPSPDDTNLVTTYVFGNPASPPPGQLAFATGGEIIGLLTNFRRANDYQVSAEIFALSGPVLEKEAANRELGFKYLLGVRILEFTNASPQLDPGERFYMQTNLWEMQLTLQWPLKGKTAPPRRKIFRSVVQGDIVRDDNNPDIWRFQK